MKLAVRLPRRRGGSHAPDREQPRIVTPVEPCLQPGVDPAGPSPSDEGGLSPRRGILGPVAVDPGFEESVLELGGSVEQTDGGVGQFGRPAGSGHRTLHCRARGGDHRMSVCLGRADRP